MIIFRDDGQTVSGSHLASQLTDAMLRIKRGDADSVLDSLLLAGQLESVAWDCGWLFSQQCSALSDALASHFVAPESLNSASESLLREIVRLLPRSIRVSVPEGFSYYALHPGDFADAVDSISHTNSIALLGIRTIGTTLSAVAQAQLRNQNVLVSRITVRPVGHPYDRKTTFTGDQSDWIRQQKAQNSHFVVLDEGPGLSGSSFLSVAESLMGSGIPADRILLIGTRECNPQELRSKDAARRWQQFAWRKVDSRLRERFSGYIPLSGGAWRRDFLVSEEKWPACWPMMESLRFLSPDRKSIFKFEGMGNAGAESLSRAQAIHTAQFGPAVEDAGEGMHRYDFVLGRPLRPSDLDSAILDRISLYCAFRAKEFTASAPCRNELQRMAEFNLSEEFGRSLVLEDGAYETKTATVVDGRMHPHEWISSRDGCIFKIDGAQHGNDHFLPGATDIRWDLAGAIVEWNMPGSAVEELCRRFSQHSGVQISDLTNFELAYSLFRLGYSKMAFMATSDANEKNRLQKSCRFYRFKAQTAELNLVQRRTTMSPDHTGGDALIR